MHPDEHDQHAYLPFREPISQMGRWRNGQIVTGLGPGPKRSMDKKPKSFHDHRAGRVRSRRGR